MSAQAYTNYLAVQGKVSDAALRVKRDPKTIRVVAVSKKQSIADVQDFIIQANKAGVTPLLGENYVQEFKAKKEALRGNFEAHLIGPLQSNKAKDAVRLFDLIQSVHTKELALLIDREAGKQGKVQEIMLQVNVSEDPQKSGILVGETEGAIGELGGCKNIKIVGLMTITRLYQNAEEARPDFRRLRALRDKVLPGGELSMGMSADFQIAVEEGATLVRVGSAIFGERA